MIKSLKLGIPFAVTYAVLLVCAPSMRAQNQNTSTAGGTGGVSYTIKCGEDEVLVGVKASSGQWIDGLGILCAKPNLSSGGWTSAHLGSTSAGKRGFMTSSHTAQCPNGYAAKGFYGKAGFYVHTINIQCYKLGAGARTGSQTEDAYGPGSGTVSAAAYGAFSCTEARPAIGVRGKAAEFVDSFGFICGYIMPATPVLLAPGSSEEITVKRPTLDWDPVTRITKPYKICLNLTSGASCAISGTVTASVPTSATSWTSTTDLPFNRGDVVYWRVEACNENGCKNTSRSFRFMPPQ